MGGRVVLVIAVLLAALCIWGFLIGPNRLVESTETALIPNLPAEWDGRTVAFISDLQIGMRWNNTGTVRRAIDRLVQRKPGVVLIGGDFTENPAEHPDQIANAIETVRPLVRGGIRTFAVLGNHDYSIVERDDAKNEPMALRLAAGLQAIGIPVLRNNAVAVSLRPNEHPIYIAGIGSHWAGSDDPAAALAGIPADAPRIFFMHNPDSYAMLPSGSAPLAVCGHTHGGQIALPFTPQWSWLSFAVSGDAHAEGWQPGYGAQGNRLYVNRGLGMSVLPVRINAPPEITYFVLTADRAKARAAAGE